MSVEVEVHSTVKRAIYICAFALLLSGLFITVKKLANSADIAGSPAQISATISSADVSLLMPVIFLSIDDASREQYWSRSLTEVLNGKMDVPVSNGRVDVLTESYAIEVDRIEKWHEGIGQAAHYGHETGKLPCLALIIESDLWPINSATAEKLRVIEKTALAQGIKLVVLRRAPPKT